MSNVLRAYFKRPTTIVGIITAIMFQLIFSVIWMTGYDGVTERIDRMQVGFVDEVQSPASGAIINNLMGALPVQSELIASSDAADQQLNERGLHMVVTLKEAAQPADAQQAALPLLSYTINESNPALIKSMMAGLAGQITASVNQQPLPEITYTNPVSGMNNQMVPMMLVLASYVGAMIMGMNLEQSGMALKTVGSRWQRLGSRIVINVGAAIIVSLVGTSLVMALGGQSVTGFMAVWGFLALIVLTFMFVSQLFLLLFGMAGMVFNIIFLSAQLVSSGAMVPRELLPDFYLAISQALPATYAVEGSLNLLFGGAGTAHAALGLLAVLAVALGLSVLVVWLRGGNNLVAEQAQAAA